MVRIRDCCARSCHCGSPAGPRRSHDARFRLAHLRSVPTDDPHRREPQGVRLPVRRVDVTHEPQLAQQFGVTQVPCFVMLVDGREVNRMIGATSREQLEQMILAAQPRVQPQVQQPAAPQVLAPSRDPSRDPRRPPTRGAA